MDICHLKNAELVAKHQKYKGRVVLQSDIVKDDSGAYAVFTEQGSSASQMTAAKVMDIISRLPGCAGQAADAVSAYTQVKKDDAPKLLKIPKSECPDTWIRLPKHKWPKSWSSMADQLFVLNEIWTVILWQDYHGKSNLRKSYWNTVGRRFPNWESLLVNCEKRTILVCVCGRHKIGWEKQNIDPMWKVLNKVVDLGEPTSFRDHVYLVLAGGWGLSKAGPKQAAADSRGSRTCVCASTLGTGSGTRRERRAN